jgi:TPR repeat protein
MSHDVFLSYSTKDKAAADAACHVLERHDIRVWMAPRDILPGADWAASIIAAIAHAKVMVLVFSSHANTSPQIEREVERAINKGIPVVPLRIEDAMPSDALEYFISAPHWLDAFTPPLEKHLERLAEALKQLLEFESERHEPSQNEGLRKGAAEPAALFQQLQSEPVFASNLATGTIEDPRTSSRLIQIGAAGVMILSAMTGLWLFWPKPPIPPPAPIVRLDGAPPFEAPHTAADAQPPPAPDWYAMAASRGQVVVMKSLAMIYSNGQGVPRDFVKAKEFLEKAAARGDSEAMNGLGLLYANGQGLARDYRRARQWYERAAAAGSAEAMKNLGDMFEKGREGAVNCEEARNWFAKAASKAHDDALAAFESRRCFNPKRPARKK